MTIASGVPEVYLSIPKQGEADTDAINCAILRAKALVALIYCQFEESNGPQLSNETMVNALWGLDGYLDQIQAMTVRI